MEITLEQLEARHRTVERAGDPEAKAIEDAYRDQGDTPFLVIENPTIENAWGVWNDGLEMWRVQPFFSKDAMQKIAFRLDEAEGDLY